MKQIVKASEGYLFNETSKKLEKYELIKIEYTLDDDTPTRYFCKLGGVATMIEDNRLPLFHNEDEFKRGNSIPSRDAIDKYQLHRILPTHGAGLTWAFENGMAIEVDAKTIGLTYQDDKTFISSGRRYYGNKEEVFMYNDYIVKEADGTERVVVSPATKMALSDEHKLLVDKFNALVVEMRQAHLDFIYDSSYGKVKVVNLTHAKSMGVDYYDHDYDGVPVDDFLVDTNISCSYTNDEDTVIIEFK